METKKLQVILKLKNRIDEFINKLGSAGMKKMKIIKDVLRECEDNNVDYNDVIQSGVNILEIPIEKQYINLINLICSHFDDTFYFMFPDGKNVLKASCLPTADILKTLLKHNSNINSDQLELVDIFKKAIEEKTILSDEILHCYNYHIRQYDDFLIYSFLKVSAKHNYIRAMDIFTKDLSQLKYQHIVEKLIYNHLSELNKNIIDFLINDDRIDYDPLRIICSDNHNMLQCLVEHSLLKDKEENFDALKIAIRLKNKKMVDILMKLVPDFLDPTQNNFDLIYYADKKSNNKILRSLIYDSFVFFKILEYEDFGILLDTTDNLEYYFSKKLSKTFNNINLDFDHPEEVLLFSIRENHENLKKYIVEFFDVDNIMKLLSIEEEDIIKIKALRFSFNDVGLVKDINKKIEKMKGIILTISYKFSNIPERLELLQWIFKVSIYNSFRNIVAFYIEKNLIDIKFEDNFALVHSCVKNDYEMVSILLRDKSIDPTIRNNYCIYHSALKGFYEIFELFIKDERVDVTIGNNALIILACAGNSDTIFRLLIRNKKVNPATQSNSAIIAAVSYENLDYVKRLMKDPRVDPSDQNNKAFVLSVLNDDVEITKQLIKDKRVDPTVNDNYCYKYARVKKLKEMEEFLYSLPQVKKHVYKLDMSSCNYV